MGIKCVSYNLFYVIRELNNLFQYDLSINFRSNFDHFLVLRGMHSIWCKIKTARASKLCLAAFESPFEALYNSHRFSYAPVTVKCKKVKNSCQNFAQKLLSILSALFKMNTFTRFALKSKRIELQRSAWQHLTAFLKSF